MPGPASTQSIGTSLVKPPIGTPVYDAHPSIEGCLWYAGLLEGAGAGTDDSFGVSAGTFIGSGVAWTPTVLGPGVNGFGTATYIKVNPSVQLVGNKFPFWMATIATNTVAGTTGGTTLSQGHSTGTNGIVRLLYNNGVANRLAYALLDDTGAGPTLNATIAAASDGLPHVLMGVSWSASSHSLYWDGVQQATSTTSIGTLTSDLLTIGLHRRSSNLQPFGGTILGCAIGVGRVPDPKWLPMDFFAAVRPRRQMDYMAAVIAATAGVKFRRIFGGNPRIGSRPTIGGISGL